jgi:hypothetical protein
VEDITDVLVHDGPIATVARHAAGDTKRDQPGDVEGDRPCTEDLGKHESIGKAGAQNRDYSSALQSLLM